MPRRHEQLRAKLLLEAACERLRNSLEESQGARVSTAAERVQAHRLAQEALEIVREAFEIEATDAPSPASSRSDSSLPDGNDTEARTP